MREAVSPHPPHLYHGVRLGRGHEAVLAHRVASIEKRGLTRHRSRHRVAERDSESLLFLFEDSLSAEVYAEGGVIYEVTLPVTAPLFRDPALAAVGALYTTVDIGRERLRRLAPTELIALCQARHPLRSAASPALS